MTESNTKRFLGLNLNENVSKGNVIALLALSFSTIMLATFIPAVQPYLLDEVLNIPKNDQGAVSGQLLFWGEIVIILTAGFWGALSDKVGRKKVTVVSFILIWLSMVIFAFTKDYWVALLGRLIAAAGLSAASAMIITLMADYIRDDSRGKATGFVGFMNGLGASMAVTVLVKMPQIYEGKGMIATEASLSTYMTMAAIVLVLVFLLGFTVKSGVIKSHDHEEVTSLSQVVVGMKAAKAPGIALAYAASFVARGNLAVVGTFYPLWAAIYGSQVLGMETADALAKGGKVVVISYAASLLFAPIFGIMTDKMNRVNALSVTLLVGVVGYGCTAFVSDPFSVPMMILLVLIGMAEVGCIITSGVLIAEQSPKENRGSVIGVFTLAGAVGILAASVVGGAVFNVMNSGPIVFFGFAALVVLIWSRMLVDKIKIPEMTNS
ncbi:MFS transporter [Temperatibacter marinus]|uniref:MFS transporter n=1 Tax=Temperatibacter marinus TaxID=1456591 RepID=A0AA52EDL9_9PROT|nr:MFS transporter [Temperatibacter marinus]WND03527.1 MFS transporter [Temperatibacter marinus]